MEVLFSVLTIADFLVLCRACKGFNKLKNYMLKKFSDVDLKLRDFVDDPVTFRFQQGKHGALRSGTFSLNILELGYRKAPYLDVFVRDGIYA